MRWADIIRNRPPLGSPPPIPWTVRIGLWATSLFFIVPAASVLLIMLMIQTGGLPLTPEQREAAGRLTVSALLVFYSHTILGLAGGILLLYRYRLTLPVLLLSAGISVANWVCMTAMGRFPAAALTTPTAIFVNLLWVEALVVTFILHRRGFLYRTFSRGASGPGAYHTWTDSPP